MRFVPLDAAASLGFLGYASSATVTPIVLVTLGRDLGFGLVGGGSLEAARSALIFLTLLGSGFIAAHFGKARALGLGLLMLAGGMGLYSLASAYWMVAVALGLAGIAGGVVEALINPLVEEQHRDDAGRYLSLINGFWSVGVLGTMVLGGDVLTRTGAWRPVLWGVAGISLLSGLLFLFLSRRGEAGERQGFGHVLGHKVAILRCRGFWRFTAMMFFGGAAEGAYTFWTATYIQLDLEQTARAGGWGTALFAMGMIAVRFAGGWLISQRHLGRWIQSSALLGLLVSVLLPRLPFGAGLLVLLFFAGASVACFWPGIQALSVEKLSLDPTSLFILLSCGGISGFTFSSWSLGWLGARHGLHTALYLIPAFFAALLLCMWGMGMQDPNGSRGTAGRISEGV